MNVREFLQRIKTRLREHYGDRLVKVILYGSEARGEASSDSDIDILCVLEGPVRTWKEISEITEATYSIQLDFLDRIVQILPVSLEDYERSIPLYMEVRKEGVPI